MMPSPRASRMQQQGPAGKQMTHQDSGSVLSPLRRSPASDCHQPCTVPLVLPEAKFAHLLKSIGAAGKRTPLGELFTVNQLCFYLKEYIKVRELFDPSNPRTIHCSSDPLGQVFGVSQFTLEDTLLLIKKNIEVIDSPAPRKRHRTPPPSKQGVTAAATLALTFIQRKQVYDPERDNSQINRDEEESSSNLNHMTTGSVGTGQSQTLPKRPEIGPVTREEASSEPVAGPSQVQNEKGKAETFPETGEKPKKKRKRTKSERPHGAQSESYSRRRHSSVSIIYNSDGDTGSTSSPCWYLEVDLQDSDETVYSIQSKETTLVKDSSDDLWFLDEDEEISFEIQSTHSGGFAEEYEVESTISSYHGNQVYMEYDSESPDEEIVVVCDESDRQFWADSESSDNEADSGSDEELSPNDKWYCENCDTSNSPLTRHCLRCWNVRPDWLSDKGRSPNQRQGPSLVPQRRDDYKSIVMNRFLSSSAEVDLAGSSSDIPSHSAAKTVLLPVTSTSSKLYPSASTEEQLSVAADTNMSSPKPTMVTGETTEVVLVKQSPKEPPKSSTVRADTLQLAQSTKEPPKTSMSRVDTSQMLHSKELPSELKSVPNLSRSQTIPVDEVTNIFKIPSCTMSPNREMSRCSSKGSHLPKLELPSDDSGLGSLTSSQESFSGMWSQEHCSSPSKVPRKLNLDSNPYPCSPKKYMTSPGRPAVSPRLQQRLLSPCKRRSPYPSSSSFSAKQSFFPFDPLLSPGKRLMRADSLPGPSYQQQMNNTSGLQSFSEEPGTTKKVFFTDPISSPKKRAPSGIDYSDVCMICLSKPKEASIIHGKTGHQVCCYLCAKKLRRRGKPCPVCRRRIQKVIKNYLV